MTSSTSSPNVSPRRRIYLILLALNLAWTTPAVAAALGANTANIFLGFCTVALGWVLWLIYQTARALANDPPPEEVAIATGRRRKELERDKQALLKALKELEFDHQMGKVSDADFADLVGNYRARAMRVMRQLDLADAGADYHKLIERDLRQRMGARAGETAAEEAAAATPPPDAAPVAATAKEEAPTPKVAAPEVAAPEVGAPEVTAAEVGAPEVAVAEDKRPHCAACNTANDSDAAFCKKCGKPLQAEASA